ncbi:MAG: protoporphyrinogen oxidase, partial [Nostocoides sp.]
VGLSSLLTAPATTSAGVWSRGALHRLPSGTLMGIPADPDTALGILTAHEVARARAERLGRPTDTDLSVGDVVAERLGDAVVDRLVEPLLGGVYAGNARLLSARAATPQLWSAISTGTSLVAAAAAAGAGAANRIGSVFAGVVGGVGSVPSWLADRIIMQGGQIRTGVIVRGLRRSGAGWVVLAGPTTEVEQIEADAVVLAVPPAPAARLLADHAPAAAAELAGIATASMAIVTLALAEADLGPVPGSGFLVPPVEGWTIKASTFSSAKWSWLAAAGGDTAYVRASMGRAGETASLQRPDDELARVAHEEIGRALGRTLPAPLDVHVQRWGGALPQYAVGHVDRVAAIRAGVAAVPALEVAGAAYDGVGIPATIGTGRRAAAVVLHELTR